MKKSLFRKRYNKMYSDFKALSKEEMKEAKAEVIEVKPKRKKKSDK